MSKKAKPVSANKAGRSDHQNFLNRGYELQKNDSMPTEFNDKAHFNRGYDDNTVSE